MSHANSCSLDNVGTLKTRAIEDIDKSLFEDAKGGIKFRANMDRLYMNKTFSFQTLQNPNKKNPDLVDVWLKVQLEQNGEINPFKSDGTSRLHGAFALLIVGSEQKYKRLNPLGEAKLSELDPNVLCRFVGLREKKDSLEEGECCHKEEKEECKKLRRNLYEKNQENNRSPVLSATSAFDNSAVKTSGKKDVRFWCNGRMIQATFTPAPTDPNEIFVQLKTWDSSFEDDKEWCFFFCSHIDISSEGFKFKKRGSYFEAAKSVRFQ